jgi:hypothetical protein
MMPPIGEGGGLPGLLCTFIFSGYSVAPGLNAAVLVTLLERQLVCLRILKMQVLLERYIFKQKVIFSTSMKCLRIRALGRTQGDMYF